MSETPEYQVGDWVRFYRDARIVIAEVAYIYKRNSYTFLATDRGELCTTCVLERRGKA